MFISAKITDAQVNQIVRRRLLDMIDLGYYAERLGATVFIHNGNIMEEDKQACGVRTLRPATELDIKVFDVLAAMENGQ